MYLDDDRVKDLVIICDHVHFSHKNERTKDCLLSPKGAGLWQNPCDTDTGSNFQWEVLAPISHLWYYSASQVF